MKFRPLYLSLFLILLASCGGPKKSSIKPVENEPEDVASSSSSSSQQESIASDSSSESQSSSSKESSSNISSKSGDVIEGPIILI